MSDIARLRFRNVQRLLDEFIESRHGVDELRGIETQFASQLGITKNYWSAIKSGKRQIGSILARQFESRFQKPSGWLDRTQPGAARIVPDGDDEWLVVGLLLSAYRREPEATKAALLGFIERSLHPMRKENTDHEKNCLPNG
jgi:hypothetical protein